MRRRRPARLTAALLVGAAVLLSACAAGGDVSWRDVRLRLPDGWSVGNETQSAIYLADGAMQGEPGDEGLLQVGIQLSHEPGTTSADWRAFVDEQGGVLEEDEPTTVGGVPAQRLVFTYTVDADGNPTREMVVVVPSRELVILAQPVPLVGETDAAERFVARRAELQAIIDVIRFGAPQDYQR